MLIKKWGVVALILVLSVLPMLSGCLLTKTPPVTTAPPPSVFVDYHRTGGIAGLDDRLVIFDNGAGLIASRGKSTEITVNRTQLIRISALFDDAGFSMLKGNYTGRHGGADFIQYSISYHGKTVITEDSAVPPSLQPLIDELNVIVSLGDRPNNLPAISRIPS